MTSTTSTAALSRDSATSALVTRIVGLSLCLLLVMICAEPLQVVSIVCAAALLVDDVIELVAQRSAAVDCADVALLCEDSDAQSTPCSCAASSGAGAPRGRARRAARRRDELSARRAETRRTLGHQCPSHAKAAVTGVTQRLSGSQDLRWLHPDTRMALRSSTARLRVFDEQRHDIAHPVHRSPSTVDAALLDAISVSPLPDALARHG